jgi:hypothetical protein
MMLHRRAKTPTKATPPSGPKPKLAMARLPYYRVHRRAFEEYVQTVYRLREFDFLLAAGIQEGEVPEFTVTGRLDTSEQRRRADEIRGGRRTRDIALIFNTLAHDGYIPTGFYSVDTKPEPNPVITYTGLLHATGSPLSPECLAFKAKHKGDEVFSKRAETLDMVWAARQSS